MSDKKSKLLEGTPSKVLGFVKMDDQLHALVKWTTGQAYMPYDYVKEYHGDMLLKYFIENREVVKFK